MTATVLDKTYSLPTDLPALEALIGLRYQKERIPFCETRYSNFRVEGSVEYELAEDCGKSTFIVRSKVDGTISFRLTLNEVYYGCDMFQWFEVEPWEGQEAYEAKKAAKAHEDAEIARRIKEERDAEDAKVQEHVPRCTELIEPLKYDSYRSNLFVHAFHWGAELLLTVGVCEQEDEQVALSFRDMAGDEVYAITVFKDKLASSKLWANLASITGLAPDEIKLMLPGGKVIEEPRESVFVRQLLEGSDEVVQQPDQSRILAACTAKATFCMAYGRGDKQTEDLDWIKDDEWMLSGEGTNESTAQNAGDVSSDEAFGQLVYTSPSRYYAVMRSQWTSEAQKLIDSLGLPSPVKVEYVYKTKNWLKSRDWWITHSFRAIYLSGGVTLLCHFEDKDMS